MKRLATLFLLLLTAIGSTSCGTLSTDYAPGGISASDTGMSASSARDWQDRTIRQLAY